MPEYKLKDKRDFKEIVLAHLEKILEISTHEFRGGYEEQKLHGNWVEKVYVPDQRKVYCQAVESWSFILYPHFNTSTKKKYDELNKQIDELLKKYGENKIEHDDFIIQKLNIMKKMFLQLNILLRALKISKIKTMKVIG